MEVYHGFSGGLFWGLEKCRLWIYWIAWNSTPWTKFLLTWFEKNKLSAVLRPIARKQWAVFTVYRVPMKRFSGYPDNPPIPASFCAFAADIPHSCTLPARRSARHGRAGVRSSPDCNRVR